MSSNWGRDMDEGTYRHQPLMSALLVICLGWCSNFAGSESGQKQSVKLLAEHGLQDNSTSPHSLPPPSHTHCLYYTVHLVWEGGEVREKVR
jgi:hypothetical protein